MCGAWDGIARAATGGVPEKTWYLSDMQGLARELEERESRAEPAANLRALDALLNNDGSDASFAALFRSLHAMFSFDRAVVLDADADALRCIAADPSGLAGRTWAGNPFQHVIDGRVLVSDRAEDADAWQSVPPDLAPPGQPVLAFPIGMQERRAVMLLARAPGAESFDQDHIATARYAAVVSLAGLALRSGDRLEAEIQRLNLLVGQLRESEKSAHQDYGLLRDIVELLPCGVTVRDSEGVSLLTNATAPAAPQGDDEVARQRLRAIAAGAEGTLTITEDGVAGEDGERTWLIVHKPVRLGGETLLLSSATDITERKRAEDEWTRRAYFDDLTGLPNRLFFQENAKDVIHRIGDGGHFAVALIDIDNFKHINDYYSHAIGDAFLVKVAGRIASHLRETDVLARVSGDEFLVLLDPIADADQARDIVDNILADLKQPFHIDTFEIFTSASIGVSLYPEHGLDYETLRRNADNAMYRVKSSTKGALLFFDPEMGRSVTARMEHEQQLRLAIRDNRFCCAFQPKVDIFTQKVVGFESLVRWRDENGESRSPGTFVSLAVELGVIDTITHFVLDETLKSIAQLDESFGTDTTFSINVPSKLAGNVNFMRPFIDILKTSGCAERIMLELTEDAFVDTNPFQTQVLPMLRDLGARISIDDFGTGYSSLASLADVTADELKVDRSFITDIHKRSRSQSILKSIESLGNALGMSMVAEGVETIEELAYLQEATHIRYAQGFYFCKPFFLDEASNAKTLTGSNRGFEAPRERLEGSNRLRTTRGRSY